MSRLQIEMFMITLERWSSWKRGSCERATQGKFRHTPQPSLALRCLAICANTLSIWNLCTLILFYLNEALSWYKHTISEVAAQIAKHLIITCGSMYIEYISTKRNHISFSIFIQWCWFQNRKCLMNISIIFFEMDSVLNIIYICAIKWVERFLWIIHDIHTHIYIRKKRRKEKNLRTVLFNGQRHIHVEPARSLCPHRYQMFTCCRYQYSHAYVMALNAAHDRYSADPKITDDRYFNWCNEYTYHFSFMYSCFPMPALYDIARTLYCYISVATLILRITVQLTYGYVYHEIVNFACPVRLSDIKVARARALTMH